jgi:hypothetical protein
MLPQVRSLLMHCLTVSETSKLNISPEELSSLFGQGEKLGR